MNQPARDGKAKAALPLWAAIVLVILVMFGAVGLFGALIYWLVGGAERLGLSPAVYLAIFVVVSGVFAWLVKRMADAILAISRVWFSERSDDE
jgi:hypothetical protein